MILITGAAGFIGSAYLWHLNKLGIDEVVVCDDFENGDKWLNLRSLNFRERISIEGLEAFLNSPMSMGLTCVVHMGACSDTMQTDMDYLWRNNVLTSRRLWEFCAQRDIPFIYASSAATYGDGLLGYSDSMDIKTLKPLNKYAYSKQLFDLWAMQQKKAPCWAGLKFFNVFGPNEYHKGRMASVIRHSWLQIKNGESVKLFKSGRSGIADGAQKRDFVYIKDVIKMIDFFRTASFFESGLYNVSTGKARTFHDLAKSVYSALNLPEKIEFIEMPSALADKYQYFTEGSISKIRNAGYKDEMSTFEESIRDYAVSHLESSDPYLS